MKKIILIIYMIILGFVNNILAQNPDQLYQIAIEANLELKAMHQEYQAALAVAPQVSQLPQPELGVGGFILPVETRLGAQRARVGLTQMFPWPGKLKLQKQQVLTKAEIYTEQIALYQLELIYQIETAWLELYELNESQQVLRKYLILLQALKKLSETKVSAGKSTLADVLRVDLKIQELSQRLEILELKKRKPMITVNQLLNRPMETSISTDSSLLFADLPWSRDVLFREIADEHPALKVFEIKQNVAKQSLAINRQAGKPSFGLGADYIGVSPRNDLNPVNNGQDIWQIRGTISLPIYRQKYIAKQQEEELRMEALEMRERSVYDHFRANIEKIFTDYDHASLMYDLYQDQIKTIKATIKILETDYSNQSKSFDELIQLETQLIDYDLELLHAIVLSHQTRVEIGKYVISR